MKIPFMDIKLAQDELRAEIGADIGRVMASGVYILGPELDGFEREFANYCGTSQGIGVSSGYDALFLIFRAMGIGPGDQVIVPAYCFVSLWFAVNAVGAVPVPVEPDPSTMNMDPTQIAAAVTPQTKAILVHHMFGQPADMAPILEVAKARRLKVVEEVSQAHGASYRGRRAGSWGDAAAFDFYPTLNLGAVGDGGAILTNDAELAERIRALRNFGFRGKKFGAEKGITSRLGEIQAAVLRTKLHRLEAWNDLRRKQAAVYQKALENTPGLTRPEVLNQEGTSHVWHRYVIRHPRRTEIAKALDIVGIQTMVHYAEPPHLSSAYAEMKWGPGAFPISEKTSREVLSLPIGPHLNMTQIAQVAQAVDREAHLRAGGAGPAPRFGIPSPAVPSMGLPVQAPTMNIPLPKPPSSPAPDSETSSPF